MFELCGRLVIAGLLAFAAGAVPSMDFTVTLKVAVAVAALGAFGYELERRKLRSAGLSGLIAAGDAFAVATLVAHSGVLGSLGFLTLGPIGFAALKHGARPLSLAAVASGGLLLAQYANRQPLDGMVLGQVLGVLLVGMVTGREREVLRERELDGMPDALAELRERYTQLRDAYRELESHSRRDRATARLAAAMAGDPISWPRRFAVALADLTGAGRVVLYTRAEFGPSLVVRAVEGQEGREEAIPIDPRLPVALIRTAAETAVAETRNETSNPFGIHVLNHLGAVVGMVQFEHPTADGLELARALLDEASPTVASLLVDASRREDAERRRREAELLYDMASLASGAESAATAAARFCRELKDTLGADSVGVYLVELDGPRALARQGADVRLIETMSFAGGPGVPGWVRIEAPELLLFDVRTDSRCSKEEALKARVGSYLVVPLEVGAGTFGYLAAASHRTGGLDLGAAETLRVASAELGHALSRHRHGGGPEGLMTPREFQTHVGSRSGCIVVLDVIRMERLLDLFGRPALAHALRRFSRRVASRLPVGGALCHRADGSFLAFLPEAAENYASIWANELAATASMIGLRTPDGSSRIPLAIRAKVALLDRQSHEIFEGLAA
jgi:GGDEF domain-containing protein